MVSVLMCVCVDLFLVELQLLVPQTAKSCTKGYMFRVFRMTLGGCHAVSCIGAARMILEMFETLFKKEEQCTYRTPQILTRQQSCL